MLEHDGEELPGEDLALAAEGDGCEHESEELASAGASATAAGTTARS